MILRIGSKHGLTLIEVLASIVILSTGAVFVMQALGRAAEAQAISEDHATANLFLLSKMADLELAFREGRQPADSEEGHFRIGTRPFAWEMVANPLVDDPDTRQVTLAVTWRHGRATYEHRIETLLRVMPLNAP